MKSTSHEFKSTRQGFGDGLLDAGSKYKDVVVLSADLTGSTNAAAFEKAFPDRFVQTGIAEQNMAGIAAGLASCGKIPFITSYGAFSPSLNWGQIKISICYSDNNVKIVGSHGGLSAAADGVTQQSLEDIALTRVLPNMTVINPIDYVQARKATLALAKHKGPAYLRLMREPSPKITSEPDDFKIGKAYELKKGDDITLFTTGTITADAIMAWHELKTKYQINANVIAFPTIKPLDEGAILKYAKQTKLIVTIEEHQKIGGFGSAIAEVLAQKTSTKLLIVGVDDTFAESGKYEELKEKYGISTNQIINKVLKFYNENK